jgi:GNAT superfamily N-acetyltransferase
MIEIVEVSPDKAEELCREITADLPEYFGLPDCNEAYANGVRSRLNLAATKDGQYIGLITLDFPYPNNGNIYWMAVLRAYQRQGVGRALLDAACRFAKHKGANTVSVETLSPKVSDENYFKTYQFYCAKGFDPLFHLKPKGYEWEMVYMIKHCT